MSTDQFIYDVKSYFSDLIDKNTNVKLVVGHLEHEKVYILGVPSIVSNLCVLQYRMMRHNMGHAVCKLHQRRYIIWYVKYAPAKSGGFSFGGSASTGNDVFKFGGSSSNTNSAAAPTFGAAAATANKPAAESTFTFGGASQPKPTFGGASQPKPTFGGGAEPAAKTSTFSFGGGATASAAPTAKPSQQPQSSNLFAFGGSAGGAAPTNTQQPPAQAGVFQFGTAPSTNTAAAPSFGAAPSAGNF